MGTLPKQLRVETVADAPIDVVWKIVQDPTRTGEWSHEAKRVEWADGAVAAAPGARFRGRNEQGIAKWTRACEVVSAEPHTFVWRTIATWRYPDSTTWTIALEPDGERTRIVQSYEVTKVNPVVDRIFYAIMRAHRDRTDALRGDLERLGALAARESGVVP